ncbi:Zn-dependent hydrolase [Rhizobium sp. KVB221]|uniref:Zn-dependent hydrolase n=1 Tax=Rhizobium setariae TaxID=2801340 RepID=A0A936YUJ5_9HYPH|nr:Zn-dependent hydrolase [Rhizobium setariae]MBL0375446.1 Zn-dependent hydrolase [Rhizobium setariae]
MSGKRNLAVSAERIGADLDALAAITEEGRPWTRRAFTPMHLEGRAYLERRFRDAGLDTHIDASGNLIGRRNGKDPALGVIMLGSHSDTVPDGGRFDGVAGVVAALEVARALAEAGVQLDHTLEVVDFLAEEVSIFGVSCIGSRGMAGLRPAEWLSREASGMTLAEGLAIAGGNPDQLMKRADVRGFLELHIEQGPILEAEHCNIGIVTAIAGITRIEVTVEGRADHAGTTPMNARCDALSAAMRLVLGIETSAATLAKGPCHFVATVGEFAMLPNAANVVPSHVRLLIDARSELRDDIEAFTAQLEALCAEVTATSGAVIAARPISDASAVPMHTDVIDLLGQSADALGISQRLMASGAGHDAAFMARISKAGMVFIPCRDGRSHAPEEWAENEDIALGTAVLMETVRTLDQQLKEEK